MSFKCLLDVTWKYYQETCPETQSKMTACYYHVTCKFQGESTHYSLPECQ